MKRKYFCNEHCFLLNITSLSPLLPTEHLHQCCISLLTTGSQASLHLFQNTLLCFPPFANMRIGVERKSAGHHLASWSVEIHKSVPRYRSQERNPKACHIPFVLFQRPLHWLQTDVWKAAYEEIYSTPTHRCLYQVSQHKFDFFPKFQLITRDSQKLQLNIYYHYYLCQLIFEYLHARQCTKYLIIPHLILTSTF